MYVCMLPYCLTKANTDRNNFNSKKKIISVVDNNANIFYTFRPFFSPGRSLACKQAFLPLTALCNYLVT